MKIGDRVKIKDLPNIPIRYRLKSGIVVSNEKDENCYKKQRYYVRIDGIIENIWFCYNELQKLAMHLDRKEGGCDIAGVGDVSILVLVDVPLEL